MGDVFRHVQKEIVGMLERLWNRRKEIILVITIVVIVSCFFETVKPLVLLGLLLGGAVTGYALWKNPNLIRQIRGQDNLIKAGKNVLGLDSPAEFVNVPSQARFFTGRLDFFEKLEQLFLTNNSIALIGMGGIGKTQIALQYANKMKQRYRYIVWLNAESEESRLSGLDQIAICLKLGTTEPKRLPDLVKGWLEQSENWLLILDNVPSYRDVEKLIPTGDRGHLIITTHFKSDRFLNALQVPELSKQDGALVVLRRAEIIAADAAIDDWSDDAAKAALKLAEEMQGLPLALDQAGAYIANSGGQVSISDYLKMYESESKNLLSNRVSDSDDHPLSVTATVNLSKVRLSKQSGDAREILEQCCFLAPEAIPISLFVDVPTSVSSVDLLSRWSFVSIDQDELRIHRVVQTVIASSMAIDERRHVVSSAVKRLAQSFLGCNSKGVDAHKALLKLLPHGMTVIRHACELGIKIPELSTCFEFCDDTLTNLGKDDESSKLLNLEIELQPGGSAREINLLSRRGRNARKMGRFAEAEGYYKAVLDAQLALGEAGCDLLICINNLAIVYDYWAREDSSKYELADDQIQRALEICEQYSCDGTPAVNAHVKAGNRAVAKNQYQDAERLYLKALSLSETDPISYQTVDTIRINLANVYRAHMPDRIDEAIVLLEEATRSQENVYGPDHTAVTGSLLNLANVYQQINRPLDAEPLLERIVGIRTKNAPTDLATGESVIELAKFRISEGKKEESLILLNQALSILHIRKPVQPNTVAKGLRKIAGLYEQCRDFDSAAKLFEEVISICEDNLTEQEYLHKSLDLSGLANCYQHIGRKDEADEIERQISRLPPPACDVDSELDDGGQII